MPLVSVIIPVYNSVQFLRQCITSVLNIDSAVTEIILVDDGSTDGSSEICDELALQNNNIKIFHQKNSGVSTARNLGIRHATGEYLYFLDSDDITLLHDWNLLIDRKDLYIGSYTFGDEQNYGFCPCVNSDVTNAPLAYLAGQIKCCIGSFIVRREIVSQNKIIFPVDIKYGEDQEFILKCLLHSDSTALINSALCLYRTNLQSAMYKVDLHRFDVALSRIRLIGYAMEINSEVQNYLRSVAVHESLTTVCEGLFRHGMAFNPVRRFLASNSEIQSFVNSLRSLEELHKYDFVQSSCALRLLQFRVVTDRYIYQLRCRASRIKSMLLALFTKQK